MTDKKYDGWYHPDFLPRETPVSPEEIEGARTELNKGGLPVRNAGYWRREAIAHKLECSSLRGEILTLGVKNSTLTAEVERLREAIKQMQFLADRVYEVLSEESSYTITDNVSKIYDIAEKALEG